jgi:NAD dependent epimerase/dehydratase family enzyme
MLLPFKMNAGGPIASGKQWMPWISMDDQIYSMHELLMDSSASGAYNLTSPNPVSQREFAKTLGRVLKRLAIAPLPSFVVKILFGEMGKNLLTEGQHVIPSRLEEQGYEFTHSDLESALRDTLGMWT